MEQDSLVRVLKKASPKEIESLCKILWPKWPEEPEEWPDKQEEQIQIIYRRFQWISSSIWGYLFKDKTYEDILREVAKKYEVEVSRCDSVAEIEKRIIQKLLAVAWEKMTPEQREKIEREIRKAVEKEGGINKKAILAAGGYYAFLTSAQLSGFGIYLAATTLLGMITNAIGITLPFFIYTSLTKAISIIIGSPGWIIGGILFLLGLKQPNYKILLPAISYVALLRYKYEEEKSFLRKIKNLFLRIKNLFLRK